MPSVCRRRLRSASRPAGLVQQALSPMAPTRRPRSRLRTSSRRQVLRTRVGQCRLLHGRRLRTPDLHPGLVSGALHEVVPPRVSNPATRRLAHRVLGALADRFARRLLGLVRPPQREGLRPLLTWPRPHLQRPGAPTHVRDGLRARSRRPGSRSPLPCSIVLQPVAPRGRHTRGESAPARREASQ